MQLTKILFCFALAIVCTTAQANPDSTATKSSAEYTYTAPTTIFGIYDPLNVSLRDNRFAFTAYGDLFLASNCFSASFLQNFFGSGFITEEMKDFASEKLSAENTLGVDLSAGLWMQMAMKNNADNIFIAGIDYNFEESSQFTPDLFHLAFYGNYDLQGETAILSGSKFSLTNVIEYKVGMMKLFNNGYNTYKLGITGGLVQGLSGLDIKAPTGTMYTAPDGRYIDFDYDFSIKTSGKNAPNLASFVGAGFSVDLFGQAYFKGPEITINAMVNDIGAVFWNNDPLKISADSTLHFEGIEINNLFGAVDTTIAGSSDSLLEILGVVEEENVFSQALPSRINISASKYITADIYFTIGAQYILNTPYKPLIFVQAAKAIPSLKMSIAANAHAGGYGVFNAGLDISKDLGSLATIRVGSNSLLGIVAPDTFRGLGAYGTLTVRL